nr:hypothetical protein BSM_15640 [uncultured archaeon]
MLDADIAAGAEVRICTIKGEKSDITKLGKISADKIDGVVFASVVKESVENAVSCRRKGHLWRYTATSPRRRRLTLKLEMSYDLR